MRVFRHRLAIILVIAASALIGGGVVLELRRGREAEYVPGERTEGLVDSLGRSVPDDRPAVRFTDVAEESGLVFHHFPAKRTGRLPEDMGSGIALGDVDGDGWTDVFLVNAAGALADSARGFDAEAGLSRLYRNTGGSRFEDVTAGSGIDLVALGMGAAFCDVDSDGDLDLFATTYGRCRLFQNDGTGRFRDISREAGIDGPEGFWTGIAVGDFDRDGAIDIYVCGYVRYRETPGESEKHVSQYDVDIPALLNPSAFEPERNLLFHGRGDGTFEEVAGKLGVENTSGRSLSAVMCDLTGDGWPDLYVANDVSDNAFFVNRGDGTFADRTSESLMGDYRGAMGLAVADVDDDGDQDLFITHWIAQENALYECNPRKLSPGGEAATPVFFDVADRYGLGQIALDKVGWATGFFDYDDDGRLDLFAVNGSTIPIPSDPSHLAPMTTQLFWNAGGKRGFFEVGQVAGDFFREKHVGRGGALFDYDLDGDEDLVVLLHGERAALLRNDGGNRNHSLLLRLREPHGNRFALGAKVELRSGARTRVALTDTQGSYLSQHAVGETAFGLGAATEVDEIDVTWPDGGKDPCGPVPADSLVTWERGKLPRIEPLPGKGIHATAEPSDVASKKRFYAVREQATVARIAGDLQKAVDFYRQALELWPGHEDCLYYLANCLRELGDEAHALETLERLVAINPRSSAAWMQIGRLRLPGGDPRLDDLAGAEAAFRRCHAINAEESRPVIQLGIVALLREDLDQAERQFADGARLNHRSVEARWYSGKIAWLRGNSSRALEFLKEARSIALDPKTPAAVANEGDTLLGQALVGKEPGATSSFLERWRTVAERDPDVSLEYGDTGVPRR